MVAGIKQILQCFSSFNDLVKHQGVVASKDLYTEKAGNKDSINGIKIGLTNSEEYVVSRYAKRLDNLLVVGDSIELYTKPVSGLFGNFITNGSGRVWNTRNAKEVFHLHSMRYEGPLVDFEEDRRALRKTAFSFPLCSLLFLGWFLYRRSKRKSPLVKEWGGWTSS